MRYFAGFIGGVVVAVLLLVFQQHLIGAERSIQAIDPPVITFGSIIESRPPETKPYETRQPPPEPEQREKPVPPIAAIETIPVQVPRLEPVSLAALEAAPGQGSVPRVDFGGMAGGDGAAAVKVPIEPVYPARALSAGIEGEVEVEFTIMPDGSVADVVVVHADPPGQFEQAARRAVLRWQFIPKRKDGVAVSVRARQVIEFRLPDRK